MAMLSVVSLASYADVLSLRTSAWEAIVSLVGYEVCVRC